MEFIFDGVGARISERLIELNLKQADLCRITGMSSNAISQYVTGKRLPDTTALYKIATALSVNMEWILSDGHRKHTTGESNTSANNITEVFDISPEEQLLIQRFRAGVRPLLDEETKQLTGDAGRLGDAELDLVLKFRAVDSRDQDDIMDIVNGKYRRSFSAKKSLTSSNGDGRTDYDSGIKMA